MKAEQEEAEPELLVLAAGRNSSIWLKVGSFSGGGLDGPLFVRIGTDSARGDEDQTAEDEDDAHR